VPADNPFSRFLRSRLPDRSAEADAFVAAWDRLETLVVDVYRRGGADAADEAELAALAADLAARYRAVARALEPHWRAATAAGRPVTADPFLALLSAPGAAWFAGNRAALQQLPAAREAINRWLVELAGEAPG
jgi:hypothetical protein